MRTTELFVEQVLIGALVLAVGLPPWWPELEPFLAALSGAMGLAGGVLALGAAYLLGIVFDRLADTLTEELERHQRLRFALTRCPTLTAGREPVHAREWPDPFPEDALRTAALWDPPPVVEWIDYHRSRIRLSRALALLLPAVTLSGILAGGRQSGRADLLDPAWALIVPVVAAVVIGWGYRRRQQQRTKEAQHPRWLLAPRTDKIDAYWYGRATGLAGDDDESRRCRRESLRRILLADPTVLGGAALLIAAFALAIVAWAPWLLAVAAVGAGLSVLSAWAWWRIGATYRTYLREAATARRSGRHAR